MHTVVTPPPRSSTGIQACREIMIEAHSVKYKTSKRYLEGDAETKRSIKAAADDSDTMRVGWQL